MGLTRRSFFRRSLVAGTGGFAAAAHASPAGSSAADTAKKPYKLVSTKEYTNVCCYCSGGCGVICSVRDGVTFRILMITSSTPTKTFTRMLEKLRLQASARGSASVSKI